MQGVRRGSSGRACARWLLLLAVVLLAAPPALAQKSEEPRRVNVAVLDLNLEGLPESYRLSLSNRLRHELHSTQVFNVVERGRMQEVLAEQGLQMSGCTSEECVVEAGRLLGVEKMIAGSVGRVGRTYTINARIINVETGRIEKTEFVDCPCEIDQILSTKLNEIAHKLGGTRPTATASAPTDPRALPRSLVWPGWGQMKTGRKVAGTVYTVAEAGAVGLLAYSILNYNAQVSEYDEAVLAYQNATTQQGIQDAYEARLVANDDVLAAQDMMVMAGVVVGGIYLVNVLDAVLFPRGGQNGEMVDRGGVDLRLAALQGSDGRPATALNACWTFDLAGGAR